MLHPCVERAERFAADLGAECPVLLAPMAGACPVGLSVAVAQGGGMGACGALLMQAEAISEWAAAFRAQTDGPFQLNVWIPDAAPRRDPAHEAALRAFLRNWGPEVAAEAAEDAPPDFDAQCEALLDLAPPAISSIMGVFDAPFVERMKAKGIKWFANATTVAEAKKAEAAGADVIVAKGFEGGGHSGAFNPDDAMRRAVGLLSLVPAIADTVALPIIATGGIADGRTAAAALMLGASAVQIGTGYLRASESTIAPAWSDAIGKALPEDTIVTRAFSGRAGRSIATPYALAMEHTDAPEPAPYPVQRALTQAMRAEAAKEDRIDGLQAWAGQSARMAQTKSATQVTQEIWHSTRNAFGLTASS